MDKALPFLVTSSVQRPGLLGITSLEATRCLQRQAACSQEHCLCITLMWVPGVTPGPQCVEAQPLVFSTSQTWPDLDLQLCMLRVSCAEFRNKCTWWDLKPLGPTPNTDRQTELQTHTNTTQMHTVCVYTPAWLLSVY